MRYLIPSLLAFVASSQAAVLPTVNFTEAGQNSQGNTLPKFNFTEEDKKNNDNTLPKFDFGSNGEECQNTPTSRQCWGKYNIDTDYYKVVPEGGLSEHWLVAEEGPCAPDGFQRTCMMFNGTIPGPTITANWGDLVRIHVKNNMRSNGTSVHWHGVHMRESLLADGVPGVTQCPIAPGESMVYEFRATQYGSSWYHSHFSLQYAEGLVGGIVIKGPATANYDEDLGTLLMQDWAHKGAFELWSAKARKGGIVNMDGGLINGTNTFGGKGKKFETIFQRGKKYLLRLVNSSTDSVFQFNIDGHSLEVIANDFVPIVPYNTSSVQVNIGQRYDVIVRADAEPGDYWLRSGWTRNCGFNSNPADITGIVRYDAKSTALPTTTSNLKLNEHCLDEPLEKLVPHLKLDVGKMAPVNSHLQVLNNTRDVNSFFHWTLNTSSLVLDWKTPTMTHVFNKEPLFPTPYNVVSVNRTGTEREWAVLIIEDSSSLGIDHPIHLHGHDFWVVSQSRSKWDGTTNGFNTRNPPRRDVASLPGRGHLALAFELDNPGAWLVHCHIAWHASQGLSLEFVEDQALIKIPEAQRKQYDQTCKSWQGHKPIWEQDDSGI